MILYDLIISVWCLQVNNYGLMWTLDECTCEKNHDFYEHVFINCVHICSRVKTLLYLRDLHIWFHYVHICSHVKALLHFQGLHICSHVSHIKFNVSTYALYSLCSIGSKVNIYIFTLSSIKIRVRCLQVNKYVCTYRK